MKDRRKDTMTMHTYAGQLIPAVPDLISRITSEDWERSLGVITDKHFKIGGDEKIEEMRAFVSKLVDTLKSADEEDVPYFLNELERIPEEVKEKKRVVDLEGIVLDSLVNRSTKFSRTDLSKLHGLFFRMYSDLNSKFLGLPRQFDDFASEIGALPEEFRYKAIEYAEKIWKKDFSSPDDDKASPFREVIRNELEQKNKAVVAYAKALRANISALGSRFTNWTEAALRNNDSIESLIEYFEDPHNYFEEDIHEALGGLQLSEVNGRLLAYVQALTGRPIKVDKSDSSDLRCTLDKGTFLFPRTVNVGTSDEENFGIFKALASYQAGAIMFGTYNPVSAPDLGPREFFASFDNPGFAQKLFEVLELARIDSRLRNKFPGLVGDLDLFGKYASRQNTGNKNDPSAVLGEITRSVYQKRASTLEGVILEGVESLRSADSTVTDTFDVVRRVYDVLKRRLDLSHEIDAEIPFSLDIENMDEGIGEKSAGYLVAGPGEHMGPGRKFRYDEWDETAQRYKSGFVQVVEGPYPDVSDNTLVSRLIERDNATIQLLRRNFEALKPEEIEKVRMQVSGEVDYDLLVRAKAEIQAGITPSEKVYTREYKNRRSVVSLVLSEGSGSLRRFIDVKNPELRIIDIIRQAQVYFSEALNAIGDNYALASFSGETEKNVEFHLIKGFEQAYDEGVKRTIGSMRPLAQNRDGAGIRHATHLLASQPEKTRLLIYLMEGVPHDFGYEGVYALADTKKSIVEAKRGGCIPIVLAFGPKINEGVRDLSRHAIYREVNNPLLVPRMLPQLYRSIAI